MLGGDWIAYALCAVLGGAVALFGFRRSRGAVEQREAQAAIRVEADEQAATEIVEAKGEHAVEVVRIDTVADDIATADLDELAAIVNSEFGGSK